VLAGGLLAALGLCTAIVMLVMRRRHGHDDFGPSVYDYAAFRAALAAVERREQVRAQAHSWAAQESRRRAN
jgi:hypothetical protein